MSKDELAKRVGLTLLDNSTDCNCGEHETELKCAESGIGCMWRPLFESCHPPELIDGSEPICTTTIVLTMSPTLPLPEADTNAPTTSPSETGTLAKNDPWYLSMFKSREHDAATTESNSTEDSTYADDDDSIPGPDGGTSRKLSVAITEQDSLYKTDQDADQRLKLAEEPEAFDIDSSSSKADIVWAEDESTEWRIKPRLDDTILDPSAPDKAKIVAALKTQDFWMTTTKHDAADSINKPRAPARGRKLAVNSADPWYANNIVVDKYLKSKNPHKVGTEEYISYNNMMKEEHKLEAKLRNADYENIKKELHHKFDNFDKYSDTIETLAVEDMIQEEHKLKSMMQQQETELDEKTQVISNLRKEELHYESKITRLESLLTDMENAPTHSMGDAQDKNIVITEF